MGQPLTPVLSIAAGDLRRLRGRVVEVFCRLDESEAWERFEARAGTRHPGHFDEERTGGEPWGDEVTEPVAGGWPVLEVDTTVPVDADAVVAFVRDAIG
jgi:hypothetical protein